MTVLSATIQNAATKKIVVHGVEDAEAAREVGHAAILPVTAPPLHAVIS